jgi:hypothetical protein
MIITHENLIKIGAKWLNTKASNIFYKSQFVVTELVAAGTKEIPDIFGFRPQGNVLIEVKISRKDFLQDKKKLGRKDNLKQLGSRRLYLVPEGLVSEYELPEGWGLAFALKDGGIKVIRNSELFDEDFKAAGHMMYSVIRRLHKSDVFEFNN